MDKLKADGFDLQKKQVNLPSGPIKILKDDYIVTISHISYLKMTLLIYEQLPNNMSLGIFVN